MCLFRLADYLFLFIYNEYEVVFSLDLIHFVYINVNTTTFDLVRNLADTRLPIVTFHSLDFVVCNKTCKPNFDSLYKINRLDENLNISYDWDFILYLESLFNPSSYYFFFCGFF